MKTDEVPLELRPFFEEFTKLEYRHDYVTVFDDFLAAMMNFFTPPQYKGFDVSTFNKYNPDERLIFGSLIRLIIQCFDKEISAGRKWFDPFGDFYQLLASRGKQSSLGQFFTPSQMVDFMVLLTIPTDLNHVEKGLKINDPACGSGRMLISFHARCPGNYVYGEDIDLMCCKMACLNLMMHGCEGEIVNHNSLHPDEYRYGWKINSSLRKSGLPSIVPIEKENSYIYTMWQHKKDLPASALPLPSEIADKATLKGNQLQLFV
jgi:type I restriction enzyme M protein